MGLFDTNDTETMAQKVAEQVLKSAENQARMISQTYKLNFNKIWKNPDPDVKPEDVIAAFKTNAVKLFTVTNASMAVADPEGLQSLPDGYTWAPKEDGSIELTYTAPPAPEPPAQEVTPEPTPTLEPEVPTEPNTDPTTEPEVSTDAPKVSRRRS